MTPRGRRRATFRQSPARSTTSTTRSTFLYASGASSPSVRRLSVRTRIPRSSIRRIRAPGSEALSAAAHAAARTVARRAEAFGRAPLRGENVARGSHAPGNDDGLPRRDETGSREAERDVVERQGALADERLGAFRRDLEPDVRRMFQMPPRHDTPSTMVRVSIISLRPRSRRAA